MTEATELSASLPRGRSNYPTPYRIGAGIVSQLPDACRELGFSRVLVVTDAGVAGLPWFGPLRASLESEGLLGGVFSAVSANPTGADVDAGLVAFREAKADGIVLVGGGSPMDVGKCVALLAHNPGTVFDYEDVGDNYKRADPDKVVKMIAIPTTAGTGSEVGRCGVIADARDHAKKIIFHARLLPSLVIADADLTLGLPPKLTAATGMDALAHAFEAYCAPGYHPMADGIALEAMRLVDKWLPIAVRDGSDRAARTHMLMASTMGATAFQKGLGLVHALSHPLGGVTGIHHGTANAIFLPYVLEFNRPVLADKMQHLARVLDLPKNPAKDGVDLVLDWLLKLRAGLGMPHALAGHFTGSPGGADASIARKIAEMGMNDPSLGSNPREATVDDLERIMRAAFAGDVAAAGKAA
jgi:alcohol dehydrogenase class IV